MRFAESFVAGKCEYKRCVPIVNRTARGRGLDQEGQRAGDLSGRSDAVGGMGDELTVRTEQTARTGAPR